MNRFCYRLPNSKKIVGAKSDHVIAGIHPQGFVIAPFDGNPQGVFTIPEEEPYFITAEESIPHETGSLYAMPRQSTTREEFERFVGTALDRIGNGRLEKCVAARVELLPGRVDVLRTFSLLCETYPNAFVFYFNTPQTGAWIGASPEMLLRRENRKVYSMALAGTRCTDSPGKWDKKNIHEQEIVAKWIAATMNQEGFRAKVPKAKTLAAGPVEHLMTLVEAKVRKPKLSYEIGYRLGKMVRRKGNHREFDNCARLARTLSPTPAICGVPKDSSLEFIRDNESFERGYYGGFCGPVGKKDFSFYVNIRSARIDRQEYALFAGAGIVEGSQPATEWEETERKLATLNKIL